MLLPFVLLSAVALAVVLYCEQRDRSDSVLGGGAKVVASASFLAAALALGAFDHFYGQTLFIALAWCFVGDVLLIFRASRPAFMFGIAAFLMGHLGYVMLFRMQGVDMTAVAVGGAVLALVGVLVWRWLAPHVQGGLRAAVIAYLVVITLMVAFAIGATALTPAPLPIVPALLFWLSDLTVARQRFVVRSFWNRAVGLPLYYAAQLLFVAMLTAS